MTPDLYRRANQFILFIKRMCVLSVIVLSTLGCYCQSSRHQTQRIEEAFFLSLGGIEQWITIRGNHKEAPVLLVLHGGPGDVQSPLIDTYVDYGHDFIVVQWDQRGSGKTYGKYKEHTPSLTLNQLISDGVELAEYLNKRFKKNGLIVLGHSFGTAIATGMIEKRADLFKAYVGTGQIASWAESVQWQFDYLKNKASVANDTILLNELLAIGKPDPSNARQYFGFTRSLRQHLNAADLGWLSELRKLTETIPKTELDDLIGGMNFSGNALLPFQMQENLSGTSLTFQVPYYVIQGRYDLFTPTAPALRYFEKVSAPSKKIVIIENAGHFALVTHKSEFIAALRNVLSL